MPIYEEINQDGRLEEIERKMKARIDSFITKDVRGDGKKMQKRENQF